ncbi:MAG: beta-hydroxyacyl-ACP dehydratase [Planctomycetes bacterium]|nr:beta-hydroxyacyl-ACP dehydratase [Planctomycetota bacterium]
MPPPQIVDLDAIDFNKPVFTLDDIRRVNPQRHEMEQVTAIVHYDEVNRLVVGYKDVTDKEFWIAGHMPGFPLMPGVLQCECAAQLAGFYARKTGILGGDYLGFGGMDDVRFRSPVFPGCRLVIAVRGEPLRNRRRAEFEFQGFVKKQIVFSGRMIGVPITREHKIK